MVATNLKISLLENTPFLVDGKFNLEKAMDFSGKVGGICYSEAGLIKCLDEEKEVTDKRVNMMTSGEHQSVFEHVNITMYIKDSSKMFDMVMNNEHQYSTSERSLRYTTIKGDECNLSPREIELYQKWHKIFFDKISEAYGQIFKPGKIDKLAKENARYLTSVFINTEMVHTIPLAQLNRILRYMQDYIDHAKNTEFDKKLCKDFVAFIEECKRLNLFEPKLQSNLKARKLEIFGENLMDIPEEFGVTYSTNYQASLAEYAQAQRHRKGEYMMELDPNNGFYIPEIIENDDKLRKEFLKDMISVMEYLPQGTLVDVNETGSFKTFIMKAKERDCSAAQLEIFKQTMETKQKYYEALKEKDHPYVKKLEPYMRGRRCSYPDFNCPRSCGFAEGINGTRRI